jgi:hypothetical protein
MPYHEDVFLRRYLNDDDVWVCGSGCEECEEVPDDDNYDVCGSM